MDCHTHLGGTQSSDFTQWVIEDDLQQAVESTVQMRELMVHGVTTIRDISRNGLRLKRAVNAGRLPGPRIVACGPGISPGRRPVPRGLPLVGRARCARHPRARSAHRARGGLLLRQEPPGPLALARTGGTRDCRRRPGGARLALDIPARPPHRRRTGRQLGAAAAASGAVPGGSGDGPANPRQGPGALRIARHGGRRGLSRRTHVRPAVVRPRAGRTALRCPDSAAGDRRLRADSA
ncbi:hypothetical protein [Streptomyces niveus]|uniref:hypothetical protein n=1 Tax=Streptomyces niveus TaxID=193462 RepID=UPI0035DEA872